MNRTPIYFLPATIAYPRSILWALLGVICSVALASSSVCTAQDTSPADSKTSPSLTMRMETYRKTPEYYRERYRPQFHFTPEMNWMNDPNGLVFHNGEYHLFYQHNPHANEWGHMSWGHAVSKDMLRWNHLPIALQDEYGLMAFSGSAVVDTPNSSGFSRQGESPLVAIYTGHGYDRQAQDLAFSNDNGRTWTKYLGNPVLDLNEKDFRDPKVFWHDATGRWIMLVSLANKKVLQFYASDNLKDWSLLSEFGPAGVAEKPNWECPDIFELPIQNEPGQSRWVLEVDMGSNAIAGGSGGEYFTGTFDGTHFIADSQESQWVDFGRDFYAPISWNNIPAEDGRRLWIGWMNNWETCLNPTFPWRSAMSIPRELSLKRVDGVLKLCQVPVRELESLRERELPIASTREIRSVVTTDIQSQQIEIDVTIKPDKAKQCGVRVLKKGDQFTEIGYDAQTKKIYVDRTKSGNVDFHPAFAGRHQGPISLDNQSNIRLHILIDACSVEVFGNDGETVITDLVFPDPDSTGIEFFSNEGSSQLIHAQAHSLRSVWFDK